MFLWSWRYLILYLDLVPCVFVVAFGAVLLLLTIHRFDSVVAALFLLSLLDFWPVACHYWRVKASLSSTLLQWYCCSYQTSYCCCGDLTVRMSRLSWWRVGHTHILYTLMPYIINGDRERFRFRKVIHVWKPGLHNIIYRRGSTKNIWMTLTFKSLL